MARMCVLLGIGAAVGISMTANAWPGLGGAVQAAWHDAGVSRSDDQPEARGLLKNPGSYIVVRRTLVEEPVTVEGEQTGGLIALPSNVRAGDPAFAQVEPAEDESWVVDEGPTVYGPYGMVFAEGVRLGYTTLRRNGPHRVRHHRDHVIGDDVPAFGSSDLHRSAQLKFAEAAQPRLAEHEAGFRRAQLRFHEATVTPGVYRGSDGLRHERTGPTERRGGRRSRD